MVKITGVFNCDECGCSYLEDVYIDENQLIDKNITVDMMETYPNDYRVELRVPSCKSHKNMKKID